MRRNLKLEATLLDSHRVGGAVAQGAFHLASLGQFDSLRIDIDLGGLVGSIEGDDERWSEGMRR